MLFGIGGTLLAAATGFQLVRLGYDEPGYQTLEADGAFEVRRYAPRVVARTVVAGAEDEVTSEGFRRLAGYIFGGNGGDRRIAMTTPVEREPVGTRIARTTPVERAPSAGGWVVAFTMPSEHSLESLPAPNDDRVTLRELPGRTVAVLRFAGRADVASRRARTDALRRELRARGWEAAGAPALAQYDPPWVLGPFRRNEVQIPVRRPG
ncbi:MAG TPA: heme-binding protein [Sandaracinaceae bacterium LLY-WYZ-13_1]|nr:heme-binding protein [Sandaracinaceae bacterium LLY-WYZ-13_1]